MTFLVLIDTCITCSFVCKIVASVTFRTCNTLFPLLVLYSFTSRHELFERKALKHSLTTRSGHLESTILAERPRLALDYVPAFHVYYVVSTLVRTRFSCYVISSYRHIVRSSKYPKLSHWKLIQLESSLLSKP